MPPIKKAKNIIEQEEKQNSEKQKSEKQIEDSNIINHFPLGFFKSFTVKASILNYKLGMYWIPLVFWFIIMTTIINYILFGGIIDNMNDSSIFIEIGTAILAGIIMFIVYFITDIIYQGRYCSEQSVDQDISNSLFNSLNISIWVAIGYFVAALLFPESYSNVINRTNDGLNSLVGDAVTMQSNRLKNIFLTDFHKHNKYAAILFYFIGMAYNNPYHNDGKSSRNKLCK